MAFTPSLDGLKALAHPRRLRILEWLGVHGPATSARVARGLGLNSGATSYHLRELARHGFVVEAAGAGRGRERWWRVGARDLRFPAGGGADAETRSAVDELNRLAYVADLRAFEALRGRPAPDGWQDALPYSRGTVRLTADELRELFEAYIALLNRYKRPADETPPGARTVYTRFLAFPDAFAEPADEQPGQTGQTAQTGETAE